MRNKKASIRVLFILILFILGSILAMVGYNREQMDSYTSSNLRTIKTSTSELIQIDYVDSDGNICIATDKGYATILYELNESSQVVKESYYDEKGKSVYAYSNQYAIVKIWDGNKNVEVIYQDEFGEPMNNSYGYASNRNFYNDKGQLERELYYGKDNEPIQNYRGEYGIGIEYDDRGRKQKVISLDKNGKPVLNNYGFCFVLRTFNDDDTVYAEMYYGIDGEPIRMSDGRYGSKYKDSRTMKLDLNGSTIVGVDDVFSWYPWLIVVAGILITMLMSISRETIRRMVLLVYLLFILYVTVVSRRSAEENVITSVFWSYKQFFTNYNLRVEILNNIWLFIPLGAGIRSILQKPRYLILPFLLSISIEAAQYFFHLGLCELDDVFSNTLGGCIGFLMAFEIEEIIGWLRMKRKSTFIGGCF